MTLNPWTFTVVAVAGWMNRQQQQVIEYLRTENQILREKLGTERIFLNESQRVRLATAAMKLGRDLLRQFGTLFSPDTRIRWNRWSIARKYDGSGKRGPGHPEPLRLEDRGLRAPSLRESLREYPLTPASRPAMLEA